LGSWLAIGKAGDLMPSLVFSLLIIALNYFQLKEGASNLKTHLKTSLTEKLEGNLKFALYTMLDICRIMSIPSFLAMLKHDIYPELALFGIPIING